MESSPTPGWQLSPAPQGGLYAEIGVGDRCKLLFEEISASAESLRVGGGETLWVEVTAHDRPEPDRFRGAVVSRASVVSVPLGTEVAFGMRHVLDWRSAGYRSPFELLAGWLCGPKR